MAERGDPQPPHPRRFRQHAPGRLLAVALALLSVALPGLGLVEPVFDPLFEDAPAKIVWGAGFAIAVLGAFSFGAAVYALRARYLVAEDGVLDEATGVRLRWDDIREVRSWRPLRSAVYAFQLRGEGERAIGFTSGITEAGRFLGAGLIDAVRARRPDLEVRTAPLDREPRRPGTGAVLVLGLLLPTALFVGPPRVRVALVERALREVVLLPSGARAPAAPRTVAVAASPAARAAALAPGAEAGGAPELLLLEYWPWLRKGAALPERIALRREVEAVFLGPAGAVRQRRTLAPGEVVAAVPDGLSDVYAVLLARPGACAALGWDGETLPIPSEVLRLAFRCHKRQAGATK